MAYCTMTVQTVELGIAGGGAIRLRGENRNGNMKSVSLTEFKNLQTNCPVPLAKLKVHTIYTSNSK